MKFTVTFKAPDVLENALDEIDSDSELEQEQLKLLIKKFIKFNEICQIEFDTETMTAKVLER